MVAAIAACTKHPSRAPLDSGPKDASALVDTSPLTCAHDGDACDDGDPCTDDDTCEGSSCVGTDITCATPPAATCVSATKLRTYATTGTCTAGACAYGHTDETCAIGCAAGACTLPACTCADGVSCCDMTAMNPADQANCTFDQVQCGLLEDPWHGQVSAYIHQHCAAMMCQ